MPRGDVKMTVTVEPTPDDQAKLYAETDARFAAQTGITRKLDPQNKLDAKWIGVWHDLYDKVLAQWRAGTLAYTYDHPSIAQQIVNAGKAAGDAMSHLGEALTGQAPPAATPAGIGMGSLAWAQTPAGQATAASSDAARKAGEAQARVEAAVQAAHAAQAHGARHGIAPPVPPPAVVAPDLVRNAAADIASEVERGLHGLDRTIGDVADAIAAMQAANAPALADRVNQIATSPPAPTPGAVPPAPGPASTPPRGARHLGWFGEHGGELGAVAIGVAAVGLGAVALASSRKHRSGGRRRSSGALRVKLA